VVAATSDGHNERQTFEVSPVAAAAPNLATSLLRPAGQSSVPNNSPYPFPFGRSQVCSLARPSIVTWVAGRPWSRWCGAPCGAGDSSAAWECAQRGGRDFYLRRCLFQGRRRFRGRRDYQVFFAPSRACPAPALSAHRPSRLPMSTSDGGRRDRDLPRFGTRRDCPSHRLSGRRRQVQRASLAASTSTGRMQVPNVNSPPSPLRGGFPGFMFHP
jgi:hypothetical protein